METKMKTYEIHPICELMPIMDDDQVSSLYLDIRQNGIIDPVILFEGKVLDGRHRYMVAEEASPLRSGAARPRF